MGPWDEAAICTTSPSYATQVIPAGQRFGRWVVMTGKLERTAAGVRTVEARCDCGTVRLVRIDNLLRGGSQSCGCQQREIMRVLARQRNTTHGMKKQHPDLYGSWHKMVRRCHNPRAHDYERYGGRGIEVWAAWRDDPAGFITWILANLGPRPDDMTLDRIDNDSGYEPGNLRWATVAEQNNNRRPRRWGRKPTVAL